MKQFNQLPKKTSPFHWRSIAFVLAVFFNVAFIKAQSLTVTTGVTVNITSSTYYDNITVNNGGTLNILSPAVLTVGATGTPATTIVLDLQNNCTFLLGTGATLIVNGGFNNSNNSDKVVVNGTVTVNGNFTGGNNSVLVGNGTLNTTGSGTITGAGTFFGNSNDCTTGPCNGNNLCNFPTANTITASGTVDFCTGTNTTPIINGSAITGATYVWQSSPTIDGTYSNVGTITQNFDPPNNLGTTIFYKRNATISGCTQFSNIISYTVGAAPAISIQPSASQTVCVGNTATFNVIATGVGLSYQWKKGAANIVGATSATYTIPSVAVGDAAANYNCVVSSTCPSSTTSSNAALVVTNTALPVVTASVPSVYCVGGTITLTGTRSGGTGSYISTFTGPNGYGWSSAPSSSTTNVSNTVSNNAATAAMAGTYTHTVTDGNNCTASATATNTSMTMSFSQIPTNNLIARYNFSGNANDNSGNGNNGTLQNTPTPSSDRITQANSAYTFNGSNQYVSTTTSSAAINTFSFSIWFNTTTTSGGKLIGYGNNQTGNSSNYDRHLYMTNTGTLIFGVYPGSAQTISSPSAYNDGSWHMATASLSTAGMKLYVDGALVASNASVTTGSAYTGYWRIGQDNLGGWPSLPTSTFFQGSLDDISIYSRELSASEVSSIYTNPNGATSPGVCQGGTLGLFASTLSGVTYSWSGPNSFTSALQNPTVSSMSVAKTGIYTVTASLTGCPTTATASTLGSINSALNPNISQIPSSGLIGQYSFSGNALDVSGSGNNGTLQAAPTATTDRFGQTNTAYSFNGTSQFVSTATQFNNPTNFTASVWFNTTTTSGGKLIGFGSGQTGVSGNYDRHIYMTNAGTIVFGVYSGSVQTIASTTSYNDGVWHLATASLSSTNGMKLYIDGILVQSNAAITTPQNFTGYWRIGYDNLDGWTSQPTSRYFQGKLDDILIYNRELSAAEVTTTYSNPTGASSPAVCTGGTLNISATSLSGASYSWTGPNSFASTLQNPTIANMSNANVGTYTLTVTAASGCISDPIYTSASINTALNPDMSNIPSSGLTANYVFSGNANDFGGSNNNGTLQNAPALVTDRFLTAGSAYSFNGTNQYISTTTQLTTPTNFAISLWFKTSTTTGGKLIGFGDVQTGLSGSYDKHIYMSNAGNIIFGVYPGSVQTISSPTTLRDGNWHHVIASLSSTNGMKLYIDGVLAASNASITTSQNYSGYWKIGYDNLNTWTSQPTSLYFNGSLDDIAIYNKELSAAEITSLNVNSATGSNSPVCTASPIYLTAKTISGASYSWTGPNSFTSTSQNPSIASAVAANAGTYNVVARITATGCTATTVPVVVSVSATTIANNTISSAQSICGSGTPAALNGSVPTGGSGGFTYQWLVSTTSASTGFTNIPSATAQNYAPGVLTDSTWYRRDAINSGCKNTTSSLKISILQNGTWVGSTSSNWNTAANWCGGVPISTTNTIIQSGTTFQPQITATANANNININSGATLTLLSGIGLNIYGNFTNNGTFTDNGGTVSYLGSSAQTALNMGTVKNLTINNSGGVVLNSNLTVSGVLTLTSGALNSSGKLTVNLTTGNIDKSGSGSVTGNMTVLRNASEISTGWHYVGSPLGGATFNDFNDNITLSASNFFGYNESDGNIYIQARWKKLLAPPLSLPLTTSLAGPRFTGGPGSLMTGYAIKFPSALPLDITGTYTHGSAVSYTTGSLSYTNGGQAWGNGWQLVSNPFPSYIDWRSASVTKTNLENGITYYNAATNQNADYMPAVGMFPEAKNNGGSPFIPAMQAFWVQVLPAGNGSVTIGNAARVGVPDFTGYPSVPSFYREARPTAQSFKLSVSNVIGKDETNIRFGSAATTKFDNGYDMYNTGDNAAIPTVYSVSEKLKYNINSLPEIADTTEVQLGVVTPISGEYTIAISELGNMEDYSAVNLYDKQTKLSQNLLVKDTYTFTANKGDAADRFIINFKPSVITNINNANSTASVKITGNGNNTINLTVNKSKSGLVDVIITNILGQDVYKAAAVDARSGNVEIKLDNASAAIYVVKAIVDGQVYSKEVFLK